MFLSDTVKPKRYVVLKWEGSPEEKITSSKRTIRLKEREVTNSKNDPSVAEYISVGNGKFKLKYPTGYFCRDAGSPGVVICKNRDEKYTDWEFISNAASSKMKTEGLCLRRMGTDHKTGEGGRYLNASSCILPSNGSWTLEDVEIDQSGGQSEDSTSGESMMSGDDKNGNSSSGIAPVFTSYQPMIPSVTFSHDDHHGHYPIIH